MLKKYDHIVLGAGMYGLYAAGLLGDKGRRVAVVEHDTGPFQRASYINQARVHQGYHYPRSISTASKTAGYYDRFNTDFAFALNTRFRKVYAISAVNTLTNAAQFKQFCDYVGIQAVEINTGQYFNRQYVEAAFETEEYSFDPKLVCDWFMGRLSGMGRVVFHYGARLAGVERTDDAYRVRLASGDVLEAGGVVNTTYASVNQVLKTFGFPPMRIKYEICEVIMVDVDEGLKGAGLTVMDGPFFSVMPFGLTGRHSLTAVSFTPHLTSHSSLPSFSCQGRGNDCSEAQLENCNTCPARPATAWKYMNQLAKKYLREGTRMEYSSSLFAIKPILAAAELDDSRPTVIKSFSERPSFVSVLSGKINTVYDLDGVFV
ncbi:MAG: FAD-binding oxidoreductase [Deltaproteobacteria bacterium]|nr:FAD-binding oxidoreductase [Deltaproteobacteria bacterium]